MKKTAIVILNWNGKNYLERFLPSVIRFSDHDGSQVYVVDNGSTDHSVLWLEKNLPEVKIICFEKNLGFALGYKKALSLISADYYILLNSDVEVTDGWLQPLIHTMESDGSIGACMPKIRSYNNNNYFEYAGAAGGFIDTFGYPFCRGRILNSIEEDKGQYDNQSEIFWASGACMMVRATSYGAAGGMDGDFFAHMEEIDLCWRMKRMGYRIICNPRSVVFHVGGGTLPNNTPRKIFLNYRNNLYLLFKNLPPKRLVYILGIRMLLDGMSALAYLLTFRTGFFISVLKAHFSFYREIPHLFRKRKELYKMEKKHSVNHILKGSILVNYFLKKRRAFTDLNF